MYILKIDYHCYEEYEFDVCSTAIVGIYDDLDKALADLERLKVSKPSMIYSCSTDTFYDGTCKIIQETIRLRDADEIEDPEGDYEIRVDELWYDIQIIEMDKNMVYEDKVNKLSGGHPGGLSPLEVV